MSVDVTGESVRSSTRPGEVDTLQLEIDADVFAIDWHRTVIHTRPQHDCPLCPPVACSCGHSDGLCPDYFEHRREWAGSEQSWRELPR
jgi:hypothetical protein